MKVALACENPNFVAGVEKGFSKYYDEDFRLKNYLFSSAKGIENIGSKVFINADKKLWKLRQEVNEPFDLLTVVEDGLFSKGGDFYYYVVTLIQLENNREVEYKGTSVGLMIPENKQIMILNKCFSTVYSDDDLKKISKGILSYEVLAQQAAESALAAMSI